MSNLSIYTALSGLRAQQQNMDVTSQNIANANTPGYSRQRAVTETTAPWPVPGIGMMGGPGQFGTGVEVKTVERVRDQFLDQQIRQETLKQGEWQQRDDTLSQVQTTFMEISDTGLNSALSNFWSAWDQLSKSPESLPVRTTVTETSSSLADALRHTYDQLQQLQGNLNDNISIKVSHINDDLAQIAGMNQQIQTATVAGLTPNDLLDKRDALLDDLNKSVSATTIVQPDNGMRVMIGGMSVVEGANVTKLAVAPDPNNNKRSMVVLELGNGGTTGLAFNELGGELQGLATARDKDVQTYLDGLDQLASGLADQLNSMHMSGYGLGGETGIPFFVSDPNTPVAPPPPVSAHQVTSAKNMYVNPYITADASRMAAAAGVTSPGVPPAPGDNGNALAITQLQNQAITFTNASGTVVAIDTANNFYKSLISGLGVVTNQADNMVKNQGALVTQLNNRKDSISGVSLDEEMANMVQYQSAYQASAKLINVIDSMMQTLINMVRG